MPIWHIYHPKGTFDDFEPKNALVRDITKLYTDVGLPPFYVNIFFHPLDGENIWIGGVPQTPATAGGPSLRKPFIRLVSEHIAINMGDDKARNQRFMDRAIKVRGRALFSELRFLITALLPCLRVDWTEP